MRLHLGCGKQYWPGFTNVDKFVTSADVISDCTRLEEFKDGEVSEIHALHLLEHFNRIPAENAIRQWFRVLKPGGKLVLELPCLDKIAQLILNKEQNLRLTLFGIFGDPREDKPGMEHKWAWTQDELEGSLKSAGFSEIKFVEPKFHIPARDMRVEAIKPFNNLKDQ